MCRKIFIVTTLGHSRISNGYSLHFLKEEKGSFGSQFQIFQSRIVWEVFGSPSEGIDVVLLET